MTKECKCCGRVRDVRLFAKNPTNADKLQHWCRDCISLVGGSGMTKNKKRDLISVAAVKKWHQKRAQEKLEARDGL